MDGSVFLFSRLFHLLGVIFWIGGTVTVGLAAALAAEDAQQGTAAAIRRSVLAVATPAMLIAWIAGLTMLMLNWSAVYASAGWMHAKLTLAVVLTGLTGVVTGRLRKAATGKGELKPGLLRTMALVVLLLAVGNVLLAVMRPF